MGDADKRTPKRRYLDRFGRVITDPRSIEARALQQQLRRLTTIGMKAGRPWDAAVTIAELAAAAKMAPQRVVDIIKEFDAWYWGLIESGPIGEWKVFEDGE